MGSGGIFGDTTAVRDGHQLDEASLVRYLTDHLPQFRGPLVVRQFEGGPVEPDVSPSTHRDRDYVLRKKPPGELLPSAHQVDREYRVMTALRDSAVPVPPTCLLCTDEHVIGTPFFVMACVEGRVFRQPHLPGVPPAERRAMYDEMVDVLARLHGVDVTAAGLADYGKPGNYYARQIARWGQQYVAAQTDEMPAMDRLMAWLPEHIPPGDETTIAHGDYRRRELDLSSDRAARCRGALTGSCRRSAIRSRIWRTTA